MDRALTRSSALEAIRNLFASEPELAQETSILDVEEIGGDAMPEPQRSLLVHATDMTRKLQSHAGQAIHVRPLHVERDEGYLDRRVLLVTDDDERTVEFGAIRIYLERFAPAAQEDILACRLPLGAILKEHGIVHICRPRFYFRLSGSTFLKDAFELETHEALYGRLNHILDESGQPLADVVEVLPPLEES